MSAHWFQAYGLLIASTIPLPEMVAGDIRGLPGPVRPDVWIAEGDVPEHLPDARVRGRSYEANSEACLLRVGAVARFLITGGREILIDPAPEASAHDVRVYVLGTCLGLLLHQRGYLVLHASGIGTERGAVLFAGDSGAGKSTLLAELLRRGHRMMVDDVCAVKFDDRRRPIVVPSYPRTRLWADAAAAFAVDTTDLPRTRPTWDKYERQVPEQFFDREAVLTHVFHLAGSHDADDFSLACLGALDAFKTLIEHTYRDRFLDGLDRRSSHFELASLAAGAVTVVRVLRPANSFRVQELADVILGSLGDVRESLEGRATSFEPQGPTEYEGSGKA